MLLNSKAARWPRGPQAIKLGIEAVHRWPLNADCRALGTVAYNRLSFLCFFPNSLSARCMSARRPTAISNDRDADERDLTTPTRVTAQVKSASFMLAGMALGCWSLRGKPGAHLTGHAHGLLALSSRVETAHRLKNPKFAGGILALKTQNFGISPERLTN